MAGKYLAPLLIPFLATALPAEPIAAQEEPQQPAEQSPADEGAETEQTASEDGKVTRFDAVTSVATKTERRIEEVPAAVSVIDSDEITAEGASNLGEALENEVGVEVSSGPRPEGEFLNIRGVGGKRILLTVDGARQNFDGAHRSRLLIEPELLKTAEILRGPNSSLYGSGAIGGVVALTTKDGADFLETGENFAWRIKQGYQSANDEYVAGGTLAGRLGDLDLLGSFTSRDGNDIEQGGGEELPNSALETAGGLYKLSWFPGGGAHELGLSLSTYEQEGDSPSNPSIPLSETNPLLARENDQRYVTARYVYDQPQQLFSGARFVVYQSRIENVEDRLTFPDDSSGADVGAAPISGAGGGDIPIVGGGSGIPILGGAGDGAAALGAGSSITSLGGGGDNGNQRLDELEFDSVGLTSSADLEFDALVPQTVTFGVDYYQDESSATRNGEPRPQFPDAEQEVTGVFIQDEMRLTDRWSLLPGIRHDRYESQSNIGEADDVQESETSLRLGSVYRFTEWFTGYVNYGEAFRAPNLLENFVAGTHFLGNEFRPNPELRPENAENKEVGLRFDFDLPAEAGELGFGAAYFDNDVEDFIETAVVVETEGPFPPPPQCLPPNPQPGCINENNPMAPPIFIGGFTTNLNLPEAQIDGWEFAADYGWGPVFAELSYSRIRGENKETGEPLLNIPADTLKGNLGLQWGGIRTGLRVTRASNQGRVPENDDPESGVFTIPPTEGYTVFDIYATWRPAGGLLDGMRLDVGIDNLTDRNYRRHLAAIDAAGRNARIQVGYQF